MRIGVPREIKNHEYRVGLSPASVRELCARGHEVLVQSGAGQSIGMIDEHYEAAGARLVPDVAEVYRQAEMIVKVKEPQVSECGLLQDGQILFTYLHLAADADLTRRLLATGTVGIAYETVTSTTGGLPLLAPMSEVAGRMSIQAAATHLEKSRGGLGILLGGVPGVPPAHVVVLGAGMVGSQAVRVAVGMGARVTVLDRQIHRLRDLDALYGNRIETLMSTREAVADAVANADVVIGSVLLPGAAAPKLVTHEMIRNMRAGSVVVDVAIDQGGCFETSRPTTHDAPTYVVDGVIHYCVANMPGAVARTSTLALNNATLPYALSIAEHGWKAALQHDVHLLAGLNVCRGRVTHPGVAQSLNMSFTEPSQMLGGG